MAKQLTEPLVSIIMAVYNYENYVTGAVESLTSQTYQNLEIIVIDDRSPDSSWKVIQDLAKKDKRIRAFQNPVNMKQTRTRNFGVQQAKGEFIAFMDADDERPKTSIEKQVKYLQKHPDVVVVGGIAEFCDAKMNRINLRRYPTTDAEIRKTFFKYSPFCLASILVRADALDKDMAYKTPLEPAEDMDLALRLGMIGKFGNIDEIAYRVRTHRGSVSQNYVRVMERKTLFLRIKAVAEYGYTMTPANKLYFAAQLGTMYLMPPRFRFWLFNRLRASQ